MGLNIPPDVHLAAAGGNHPPNVSGSSSTSSCSIDESYKYVFLPVCYSLTFLFSLTLNSVVLLRSCRHQDRCCGGGGGGAGRRWNTSLIYMVNLATTDLMYGLSLPFLVASYVLRDRWVFGDFMCRLVRFLFYFNLYCSIFFLTCISVHRYLGICHPMRTITLESKRVVKGTCALVWVVVFILTCPIFRFAQTGYVRRGGGQAAEAPSSIEVGEDGPVGDGATEGVRERERTSVSISGSQYSYYIRRRRKSIKTIVTITLLFALCFLPFHVTRTLFLLMRQGQHGSCDVMKTVSICYKVTRPLASCNAWLNALLYFLTGDKGAPCCCLAERTVRSVHRSGALWWPLKILKKEGVGEDDPEAAEKDERQLHLENESKSSRVIF